MFAPTMAQEFPAGSSLSDHIINNPPETLMNDDTVRTEGCNPAARERCSLSPS